MCNFQVLGGYETVHTLISNRQNEVVFSCARVEEVVKALILYNQDQNDEAGAEWAASREP